MISALAVKLVLSDRLIGNHHPIDVVNRAQPTPDLGGGERLTKTLGFRGADHGYFSARRTLHIQSTRFHTGTSLMSLLCFYVHDAAGCIM